LLIGSDCAVLTPGLLRRAAAALADHDMVFVPAEDGGYVLVGARAGARLAPAFTGIAWSTARVMAQTREALAAAAIGMAELEPLWDIDEPADWQRAVAAGLVSALPPASPLGEPEHRERSPR
jgi:glycosyltransferase A (GT-A) superfamily protein (DUF2064 family)